MKKDICFYSWQLAWKHFVHEGIVVLKQERSFRQSCCKARRAPLCKQSCSSSSKIILLTFLTCYCQFVFILMTSLAENMRSCQYMIFCLSSPVLHHWSLRQSLQTTSCWWKWVEQLTRFCRRQCGFWRGRRTGRHDWSTFSVPARRFWRGVHRRCSPQAEKKQWEPRVKRGRVRPNRKWWSRAVPR